MDLLNENLLTVKEVAEALRVTPQAVYIWINNKQIDAIRIGGTWRVPASQFEQAGSSADAEE